MPRRKTPVANKNNNRVWIILSIVGAVVIVGGLVWLASSSAAATPAPAPKIAAGKVWGNPSAPVLIEEYSDFQ